jgi:Tol biopolymer transport system component
MKRLALIVIALAVIAAQGAFAQDAARLLKAAINTEMVDSDPKGAIEQYKKVVASGNRALAAEALLRMAGCYQKLGDAEAQKIYAQIVANYVDQTKVVAEAKARMGAGAASPPGGTTPRLAWDLDSGEGVLGGVSADGRLVSHYHLGGGRIELAVRDLLTGNDRVVDGRNGEFDFLLGRNAGAAFSRDGRKLAYFARVQSGSRVVEQLRVVDLGSTSPSPRVLPATEGSSAGARPIDWTPDGNFIVVVSQKDATSFEIGLVSTADGAKQVLKTLDQRVSAGFLSPDGKLFAYEVAENASGAGNIMVLPIDGRAEFSAVDFKGHDGLMGWSPDGARVLFASDRSAPSALWSQRIEKGRIQGSAEPVVRNFGPSAMALGVTRSGALYSMSIGRGESSVMEAGFDFANGTFTSAPTDAAEKFVLGNNTPRWSPDGKSLAYISNRGQSEPRVRFLVIRTSERGRSLEPSLHLDTLAYNWTPDSQSIVAIGVPEGADARQRGVYRIDVQSGAVSPVVLGDALGTPSVSADGRTLYYQRRPTTPAAPGQATVLIMIARDLVSGTEREVSSDVLRSSPDGTKSYQARFLAGEGAGVIVERDPANGSERELLRLHGSYNWRLTADGTSIVAATMDPKSNEGMIVLYSIADGSVRTLLRAARGQQVNIDQDLSVGRAVLVSGRRQDDRGSSAYWWVPLDGRQAKQLQELAGLDAGSFSVHPDGRRLSFAVNHRRQSAQQVWVLENFLQTTKR